MLKKTITYTNFNDEKVTSTLYFNLSSAELVEMEVGTEEGFGDYLNRIVKEEDKQKLFAEFKKLLLTSYGEKSADGNRFDKNEDIRKGFEQSAAYDAIFLELVTGGADAMGAFINGIMPKDLAEMVKQQQAAVLSPAAVVDTRDPAFVAMQAAQTNVPTLPPPPAV